MAQIAIPLLLFGTAYLVCNDEKEEEEKENFSTLEESIIQESLIQKARRLCQT